MDYFFNVTNSLARLVTGSRQAEMTIHLDERDSFCLSVHLLNLLLWDFLTPDLNQARWSSLFLFPLSLSHT